METSFSHIIKQIGSNKSSFFYRRQLFTKIIQTEITFKSNQNAKLNGLGAKTKWS